MSKCLYCQTELPEGYGMVCSSCEKDLLNHSGDCRKCLHFNYCTDKGNHAYRGCSKYFIDKDEYVKVVRCKDCKHYTTSPMGGNACLVHYNGRTELIPRKDDDFCSYGERVGK